MAWATFWAVLWFVFWMMAMVLAQIWCDYMPAKDAECFGLYDILHEFLPRITFRPLADIWGASHVVILLIYITFFLPKKRSGERVIRVFFFLWGCVYAARTFALIPTRYPRILMEAGSVHPDGAWWAFFNFFWGGDATVADFMFSGHTATMVLCTHFVAYYSNHSIFSSLMWVYTLVGSVVVSITLMHYTTDVLIAWWVVDWIFHRYHSVIDPEYLRAWRPGLQLTDIPGGIELPATLQDASGVVYELVGETPKVKRVNAKKYFSSPRYALWKAFKAFDTAGGTSF